MSDHQLECAPATLQAPNAIIPAEIKNDSAVSMVFPDVPLLTGAAGDWFREPATPAAIGLCGLTLADRQPSKHWAYPGKVTLCTKHRQSSGPASTVSRQEA
jgi:hypothetical protein